MHQDFLINSLKRREHLLDLKECMEYRCVNMTSVLFNHFNKFVNKLRPKLRLVLLSQGFEGLEGVL